jgi:hypothetical protein
MTLSSALGSTVEAAAGAATEQEADANGRTSAPQSPEPAQADASELGFAKVAPIPAIAGTPGLYTVETAETLPKGVVTISAYSNKFGTVPGSVTMLSGGFNAAAGLTKKITVFAAFEPYRHLHIGEPFQLSLRQPAGCLHDVFEAPIYCELNPGPRSNTWKGPAAGYVVDAPFGAYNKSDWGPVTLGAKANFWSETRDDPLSVSMRFSLVIPTESSATELAKFGAQSGALNFSFTLGLNKTLGQEILLASNITYLVTRNPHIGARTLMTPGDQIIFGQGGIFRARHRLQFPAEFTCVLGQEGHGFGMFGIDTENTSQGPSNPVDVVGGVRWYFVPTAALDVGYRYMLNLYQLNDRSGFTIKISKSFGWSK